MQRLEPGRYFIHGDGTLFHCRGTEQAPAKLVAEQVRDGEVREIDPSTRDSWYGLSGARATRIDSTSPETPPS